MFASHIAFCRLTKSGRSVLAALLAVGITAAPAAAADNTWTNTAGTFAWNTTDANWTAPTVWNNNPLAADAAVFTAAGAGTINVGGSIFARSLDFQANGYTLAGGTLTLLPTGTGTLGADTINVAGANTAVINSNLATPFGLTKTGTGVLQLGGTGNAPTGFVPVGASGWGANILIGSATSVAPADAGGTLRLASATALPATTSVAIGNGFLDIGANNVTLANLTFAGTKPSATFGPDQGVTGTGTLKVTGAIRVVGNVLGWANFINVPVDANGGTLRVEVGDSGNANREVMFLQPISNGSVLKTFGVNSSGTATHGAFTMLGNNTYTGATTINGGDAAIGAVNVVGGTNASTALRVANGTVSLQGANGSFGAAATVLLASNGGLVLDNTAALVGPANTPALPAADVNNRLNPAAAVTLDGGTLGLVSSAAAPITQTVASLSAPSGFNRIDLTAGAGQAARLTVAGNLAVGAGATLVIGGAGLGTTTTTTPGSTTVVVSGTLPPAVNGIIPGVYGATSAGGAPTDFVRNSATAGVGLVRLDPTDYTTNAFGAGLNVNLTSAQVLAADQQANAIKTSVNVTINNGATLAVGPGGILATAAVTFAGPGTLAFGATPGLIMANSSTTTFSGPITAANGVFRSGSGTVIFSGDLSGLAGGLTLAGTAATNLNTATYAGPINLQGGTLSTTNGSNFGTGGAVTLGTPNTPAGTVGAAATLDINNAAIPTFARNIVVVGSDGTAPFGGIEQTALGPVLHGMTLTTLATGPQAITGSVTLGTHLTVNAAGTGPTTFSGPITGAGGLHVLGGVVGLTNATNTFAGGLKLDGGTTFATADAALGTGPVRFFGGTLRTDYAGAFNRGLTLLGNGTVNTNGNDLTVAGAVAGEVPTAVLTKAGAGTLTLTASSPFPGAVTFAPAPNGGLTLAGANGALTGVSAVAVPTGATLTLDNSAAAGGYNPNRLNDLAPVTISGGTVNYIAPATAVSGTAEQFGLLTASTAAGRFNIDGSAATSPIIIHFAGLAPITSGSLLFSGTNLGGTTGNFTRILFDTAPALTASNTIPGAFFSGTSNGASQGAASYDPTRGVILFTPPAASGTLIDNYPPTSTPINSAFTTTGAATANTGVAVYDLILDGGGVNLVNGPNGPSATNGNTPTGTLAIGNSVVSQNGAKQITASVGTTSPTVAFGPAVARFVTTSDLTVAAGVTVSGSAGLLKTGAGVLTLNGASAVTGGPLSIDAGTFTLGATGTVANGTPVTLNNAGTVANFNATAAPTLGTLTAGAGTTANVNQNVTAGGLAGSGGIALASGKVLTVTGTSTTSTVLSGPGALAFTGAGALTLNGASTYSGGTTVAAGGIGTNNVSGFGTGPVALTSATAAPTVTVALPDGTSGTVANNFSVAFTGAAGQTAFTTGTALNTTVTLSGQITGTTTALQFSGDFNDSNFWRLTNPANSFTGRVQVFEGGLGVTSNAALGNPANVVELDAFNTTAGGLRFDAPNIVLNREVNLGFDSFISPNGNRATIAGPLTSQSANPPALGVGGGGTLVLASTANTFAGPATVGTATTLLVNGNLPGSSDGPMPVTVSAGGQLGGTGGTVGTAANTRNVTVAPGGAVRGGSPGDTGTLTVNGNTTVTSNAATNGIFRAEVSRTGTGTAAASKLQVNGILNFAPGTGNKFTIDLVEGTNPLQLGETYTITLASVATAGNIQKNGTNAQTNPFVFGTDYVLTSPTVPGFNGVNLSVTGTDLILTFVPVPEPGTVLAIGAAGLGLVGAVRRWRRSAAQPV